MFPEMAHRPSSSDGSALRSSSALPTSIIPGVQKPHWRPCSSLNATWTGSSSAPAASPSTVVTSRPSACTPNTVQDFTGVPSSSTVHAPQLVVSQPSWVPVRPNASLMRWTRRRRGSTSAVRSLPLTLTLICMLAPLGRASHLDGTGQASPHEHLDDMALVLGRTPDVPHRGGRGGGQPAGLGEQPLVRLLAGQCRLGLGRLDVLGPHRGEADSGA